MDCFSIDDDVNDFKKAAGISVSFLLSSMKLIGKDSITLDYDYDRNMFYMMNNDYIVLIMGLNVADSYGPWSDIEYNLSINNIIREDL